VNLPPDVHGENTTQLVYQITCPRRGIIFSPGSPSSVALNNELKILNIIFCILFVLFAAVQYNDPDPWLWIALYLYGAVLCYLAVRNRNYMVLNVAGLVIYSVYALYLFFSDSGVLSWMTEHDSENIAQGMKATKPWIEKTREFFGLMILITVIVLNMRWNSKRSHSA
jgi:hypothetical protein